MGKRATSGQDDLVTQLANQIEKMDEELIRQIRAVTDDMKVEPTTDEGNDDKCKVQNLTCVKFPTRNQCHGISFGGCASRVKYIYNMLSPRVMLFILISVAGLSLAILFIGYYWFFLRRHTGNIVEPQHILSVEPADQDGNNSGGTCNLD